jgi:thiol:disulfide interchange protein DsbC
MKNRLTILTAAGLLTVLLATFVLEAKSGNEPTGKDQTIREELQKTFPELKIDSVGPSVVPGLFDVIAGKQMFMYDPQGKHLIIGMVMDMQGRNLSVKKLYEQNIARAPLDKAIKIGGGPRKVVVFTDPDCTYCRKVSAYLKTVQARITQYVFFKPLGNMHPDIEAKCKYILSAPDPGQAYQEVTAGSLDKVEPRAIKFSEASAGLLEQHTKIAAESHIEGVPVVWIDGRVVTGADMAEIERLITGKDDAAK